MAWKFNSQIPVSIQIASILRADIVGGKYAPGDQFPTVRQLAYDASVNPNTMQKALAFLEEDGLLITRGTVGRFITSDAEVIETARRTMQYDFMYGVITQAASLGISKETFIKFINESEGIL